MNTRISLKKVMVVYAAVFLAILGIGLAVFAGFMREYENSRPDNVAQSWLAGLDNRQIDNLTADTVSMLNHDIMSENECRNILSGDFRAAKLVRSPADTTDERRVYNIKINEMRVGKLVLSASGKGFFGFPKYDAAVEELDLSVLTSSTEIVIPAEWSVACNGTVLGRDYITGTQEYSFWEEFYDNNDIIVPVLKVYNTGLWIREPEITVTAPDGSVAEELSEEIFADNCPEEMQQRIMEEAEAFITAYITYSSNVNKATWGNYLRLQEHMVVGSSLQIRMRAAAGGLGWASSLGDKLQSIEYHRFSDLGGGYWFCDLTYINDTLGTKGHVLTENNLKFIFVETENGGLLAAAMSSY